jgi:hypothetical protein
MKTILIQIKDPRVYKLLQDLEELNILEIVKQNDKETGKLSEKYFGKLSSEAADELQEYVKKSREEC